MADFDLIGKLRFQLEDSELNKLSAKTDRLFNKVSARAYTNAVDRGLEKAINNAQRQAERFVNQIERDMERVARSANKSLTKAFDDAGKKASRSLREAIAGREKQSKADRKLLDNIIGGSDRTQDRDTRKRISIEKKELNERKKATREAAALDEQEVLQSQAAFRKREAIARQEVAARVAARAKLAQEDEAEVRASQRTFQTRERLAKAAVTARVREDAAELKAGQKAFERREKFARESVKARLANGGGPPKPPGPKVNPLDGDPSFEFGKQSALALKRFAAFSLAAGGLYIVADAFRDAVKEAIDFEAQLVKLAQVSNSSIAALSGTRTEITRLSTSLGTSSKDLVASAVTIRQAGFSLEETNAALETLALTTLSASFNDLKNTTEGLIALRSQFNTSAKDYKKQFGEINAVSKAFAVESEDIVTAIRKSGGAFKVAGGNVTELIALFTAVRATTRESADTIATGFRTIFARLQRPQIIDELKAFNIELRDAQGNFVGPLKAIEEINKALSQVGQSGDLQFARVAEQIGGIRQISKVVPLIQQFTTAQRAANIARLGANSLDEDAAIAQTSLANRLTKTREKFLEFGRELTINDQFKKLTNVLLTTADAFTNLAKTIAPILPSLTLAFGIANAGSVGRFAQGFSSKISGQKNFFGQRGFANATADTLPFLSRKSRLRLGANLPLAGAIGGIGIAAIGSSIGNVNPVTNRSRFLTGRTVERAGGGLTGGIIGGAVIGSVIPGVGTLAGGAIGGLLLGAQQGLSGFTEGLREAQDALEDSKFRPAFDALTGTLSEISAGRLSPFGRRDTLNQGLQALRDRRFTATGTEREELRGNIRQTVESLLLFQQQLLDSAKTLEQFKAAGGDDAIKFISENSILTARELEKQRDAAFKNREREDLLFKKLLSSQEKLLQQSNLITAFGAALENASIKANDAAERFSFLSNTAFGQNIGVRFRGTRGFGTNTSDLGLKANSANQISSLIGLPQFKDLAAQTVGIQNIRNQLPAILSEFGTNRPIGATSEGLDTFVQKRLDQLTAGVTNKDLAIQPIIDAIVDSIESELATQGRGQNEAIQKIISAPTQFIESIFSNTELTRIDKLLADAAASFAERFNVFASQVAEITTNELAIRKNLADTLGREGEVTTEIARRRNPLNFPLAALQAGRSARANALLGGNAGAIGGNASNITPFIRNSQQIIRQRELDLQQAQSVDEQKSLIKIIVELQSGIAAANDAFELLVDNSDKIAAKFDEFDKIQLGRDQIKGGIKEFTFGGRDARNQLNLASAAASLVSANPNLFFDPSVIPDSLQPVIGDFLDRFGDAKLFNGKSGKELSDLIQGIGLRNAGFAPDQIKEFLSNDPNRKQEELLKQAGDLARDESLARQEFIRLQSENNKSLTEGIESSLKDFIVDLRSNLLEDIATSTRNRQGAVGVQQADLRKQIDQFALIQSLGGSGINVDNKAVLDLATSQRRNSGKFRNAAILASDARAFLEPSNGGSFTSELNKRFANNPAFNELLRTTIPGNAQVKSFNDLKKFQTRSVSVGTAVGIGERTFDKLAPDLELDKSQKQTLRDKISDNIAGAATTSGQINIVKFKYIISNILTEAAEQSQKNTLTRGAGFADTFQKFSDEQIKFFDAILNLPEDKFNDVATAINKLGDGARLDKVTEQLNKLNDESLALTKTLEGLTGQIQAINGRGGNAAPAGVAAPGAFGNIFSPEGLQTILQSITQGFSSFVNGSAPMTQAMNNFPRSVEMAGTHTVNVNVNGTQAFSQMQPVIEAFVQGEIQKALTKFTLDTLPGALSYSQ